MEKSYQKCVASIEKIDVGEKDRKGYVDLFLIHSPNCGAEKRKELWLALEKLLAEGRARAIGVSNYGVGQIEEMKGYATTWPPHVNQIEVRNLPTLLAMACGGIGGFRSTLWSGDVIRFRC